MVASSDAHRFYQDLALCWLWLRGFERSVRYRASDAWQPRTTMLTLPAMAGISASVADANTYAPNR